ncbi:MAG: glycosyltransferase family 2 protein [Candidatus Buchananbacteria bacterium]
MGSEDKQIKLSIILPCRNEEESLAHCLDQIGEVLNVNNIDAEVIVSDSSSDRSPEIAKSFGVMLVKHNREGYGSAYLEGFKVAKGRYLFLADVDGTYDFNEIPIFLKKLESGYDLVIGNRFGNKIIPGSMPWANRHIGNPFLSAMMRLFFGTGISDAHCGMRAVKSQAFSLMNLQTTGMEFASEMIIKAIKRRLKITELPISYYPRKGKSKLKPIPDGWRHLRFMLLYNPNFLFFIPGIVLFLFGFVLLVLLYFSAIKIGGLQFQYHPMFIASLILIIGYQLIFFALFAKTYALTHLSEENKILNLSYRYFTLEKGIAIGFIFLFLGCVIFLAIFISWVKSNFGSLLEIKNSILALTLIIIGIQTISSAFMLSILGIKDK